MNKVRGKYLYGFLLIFICIFFSSKVTAADRMVFPKYNLSNADYSGIAISKNGNIYLGNHTKEEVDVYNKNGDFLMSLPCETYGDFTFDIDQNNHILIGIIREQMLLVYDEKGNLLSSENDSGNAYNKFSNNNCSKYIESNGEIFIIQKKFGDTKIMRILKTGQKTTILAIRPQTYFMNSLKNASIVFVALLFIAFIVYRAIKRYRQCKSS